MYSPTYTLRVGELVEIQEETIMKNKRKTKLNLVLIKQNANKYSKLDYVVETLNKSNIQINKQVRKIT